MEIKKKKLLQNKSVCLWKLKTTTVTKYICLFVEIKNNKINLCLNVQLLTQDRQYKNQEQLCLQLSTSVCGD